MNELGIFAKTFSGPLPAVLTAVDALGLHRIQFNFSCTGLPSMPDAVDEATQTACQTALQQTPVAIEAVSGTFNMIHPDPAERQAGLHRLGVIARQCHWLGTNLVTLCTGTRAVTDIWKAHPGNNRADAWYDLRQTLDGALLLAEQYDLVLGIEPEAANVINSADKAARLLRDVNSPRLRIIFDPANLFGQEPLSVIQQRIAHGLDALGEYIVSVHAKDRSEQGQVVAAGRGILPYPDFLRGLTRIGYRGSLILHGLAAHEVTNSVQFLHQQLDQLEFTSSYDS